MKIAILGYGLQGESAYNYWKSPDNQITVCDQNTSLQLPTGITPKLGPDYLSGLDNYDVIVRSPSVHPKDIAAANSTQTLDKVTTVTNEFMRVCPTKNIICVTGTKGKGTTCTLITKILETDGKKVYLGGNIGMPPFDLLKGHSFQNATQTEVPGGIQPDDWIVLEVANFQLIDLNYSPPIAVCLMVVPEHQDWHTDVAEYIAAKQQLFAHQTPDDIAIYYPHSENSIKVASVSPGKKIPYYKTPGATVENNAITINGQIICKTDEIKLLGKHNWQNICAAVTAVWQVTQNVAAMHKVISSFEGLEHHTELVRELNSVAFYDDSFGTTPETTIVALEAFSQPKVVILGGADKGASFDDLAQAVKDNNVKKAVLIGKTAPKIQAALLAVGYTDFIDGGDTMKNIVQTAQSQAQSGDIVLLSTGCASFGLFKNYKDRGEQFKTAVLALS